MRLPVYFVFMPTRDLVEAALSVGEVQLVEPTVWCGHMSGRGGLEHSKEDVQAAFWKVFLANLVYDSPTSEQLAFGERCRTLGFSGCWEVLLTLGGGTVEELLSNGKDAEAFLRAAKEGGG